MSAQATFAIEATASSSPSATPAPSTASTSRSPRGAVYGVLGPNGAGKTTTIRMLATLLRPDAGSARVLGHDIVREADAVRGLVSLTGQLASVDEDLTGRENLILLGRLLGYSRAARQAARRRAARRLRARRRGEPPGQELLGRHAAPARHRREHRRHPGADVPRRADDRAGPALAQPGLGHHPRARRRRGRRSCSARSTSTRPTSSPDRIAVIDHGRVIAEGTPGAAQGLGRPGHAARPRCSSPSSAARPSGCSRARSTRRCTSSPTRRRCRCRSSDAERASEAVAELFGAGIGVGNFSLGQPSLDEVFLALTGHPAEDGRADRGAQAA